MITLYPLLLSALLGFSIIRVLIKPLTIRNPLLFLCVISPAAGLAVTSLVLFLSYLIVPAYAFHFTFITVVLLTVLFLRLHNPKASGLWGNPFPSWHRQMKVFGAQCQNTWRDLLTDPGKRTGILINLVFFGIFVFFLLNFLEYYLGNSVWNIHGGWDARYFWNLKAKFLYRDPSAWQNMFSPILHWSHPDYPLMLPGIYAWGWHLSGKEMLVWPMWVGLLYILSLCFLILWYLGSYVGWWSGFLAAAYLLSINMYRFWSTVQYADIPLAFYFTAAGIMLLLGARSRSIRFFLLSGLFAGFSIWTKDEGIFFTGWIALILTGLICFDKGLSVKDRIMIPLVFLIAVLVPLAASSTIKLVLTTAEGQYLNSGRSLSDFARLLFGNPERTQFISLSFLLFLIHFGEWNGLWILAIAALVLTGKNAVTQYRWIPVLLVILILLGYYVIIHITPHDLRQQIQTALMRIMSHAGGLALIFAFEAFSPFSVPLKNGLKHEI